MVLAGNRGVTAGTPRSIPGSCECRGLTGCGTLRLVTASSRSTATKILGWLRLALGVALIWYVLSELGPDTLERFGATTVWLLPAMAVLPFFGAWIEAVRLSLLFRSQGFAMAKMPKPLIYRIALMGAFFNVCIPGITTGGDLMRVYFFASNQRGKTIPVVAVLLVDRAVSLFGFLAVVLSLALLHAGAVAEHPWLLRLVLAVLAVMILLVVVGAIACSRTLAKHPWRTATLRRIPLGRHVERFLDAVYAFRDHKGVLCRAMLVSVLGHVALGCMFAMAGAVFLPDCPMGMATLASLLAMLANVLPLTPGGLGVGELAFDRLFETLGFTGGASLMLSWRAAMLPIVVAGGVLYALGRWRQKTLVAD